MQRSEGEKVIGRFGSNFRIAGEIAGHVIRHPSTIVSLGEKPIAASFDIAANCNLRCQHCYLYEKEHQKEEFNDDSFLEQVRQFRQEQPGIIAATWVGGEPMWRKELLRKAVKLFPFNWVVTNGTVPIDGQWHNTAFFISIDGPKDIHNQIRQPWKVAREDTEYSVYDRAKHTANTATASVHVPTTINRLNADTIPALVNEWKMETAVRGFAFSLHTPQVNDTRSSGMSETDEAFFLQPDERKITVEMLIDLKRQFGSFIMMSEEQIRLLLPENQLVAFGGNCPLSKTVVSLD